MRTKHLAFPLTLLAQITDIFLIKKRMFPPLSSNEGLLLYEHTVLWI